MGQGSCGSDFIFQKGSFSNLSFDKRDEVLCWELESFVKKGHWYPDSWWHKCDPGRKHTKPLPALGELKLWARCSRPCQHSRMMPGRTPMAPSEQRTFGVNTNMQTQGDHKPEEQRDMEGRRHMVLSWKVIHFTLLSIETDLVQAQERSLLLA